MQINLRCFITFEFAVTLFGYFCINFLDQTWSITVCLFRKHSSSASDNIFALNTLKDCAYLQGGPPCTQRLFRTERGSQRDSGCPERPHSTLAPSPLLLKR